MQLFRQTPWLTSLLVAITLIVAGCDDTKKTTSIVEGPTGGGSDDPTGPGQTQTPQFTVKGQVFLPDTFGPEGRSSYSVPKLERIPQNRQPQKTPAEADEEILTRQPTEFLISFRDKAKRDEFSNHPLIASLNIRPKPLVVDGLPKDDHNGNITSCVKDRLHFNRYVIDSDDPQSEESLETIRDIRQKIADATELQGVEIIENHKRYPFEVGAPNDHIYAKQWHYHTLDLLKLWAISQGSEDIVVAVIDTGVRLDHPDFAGRFLRDDQGNVVGYDFVADDARSADNEPGIDPNPDDPGDHPSNPSEHGSHVAGTIAASVGNVVNDGDPFADILSILPDFIVGSEYGSVGGAPNVKLMPLRALAIGGGYDSEIAEAIRYAAKLPNVSGTLPPRAANIIIMSLGGPGESRVLEAAIQDAVDAGAIVIVAAGNDGSSLLTYPAAFSNTISISAVGPPKSATPDDIKEDKGLKLNELVLAPYSNYGGNADFAAPGGIQAEIAAIDDPFGVWSTSWVSAEGAEFPFHVSKEGTSMAAPHVGFVAALMLSVDRNLDQEAIRYILADTAIPPAELVNEEERFKTARYYGAGIVNPLAALEKVQNCFNLTGTVPDIHVALVNKESNEVIEDMQTVCARDFTFNFSVAENGANEYYVVAWTDMDNDGKRCEKDELCAKSDAFVLSSENSDMRKDITLVTVAEDDNEIKRIINNAT